MNKLYLGGLWADVITDFIQIFKVIVAANHKLVNSNSINFRS